MSGSDKAELIGCIVVALLFMLPVAAIASGIAVGCMFGFGWGVLTAFAGPVPVALLALLVVKSA